MLERTGNKSHPVYQLLKDKISKVCNDDFVDITDLTGSWFLSDISKELIDEVAITSSNLNDNWENGLFDNISYEQMLSDKLEDLPSIEIKLRLKGINSLYNLKGFSTETPLDAALVEWI